MEIKVKRINENAIMPVYAHEGDTGFDIYTSEDVIIAARSTAAVPTGLKFELPEGYGVMVRNRSGNTLKGVDGIYQTFLDDLGNMFLPKEVQKMDIKVQIGTIDNGYRGEVKILATNNEMHDVKILKGTKLAQGIVEKINRTNFIEVSELNESDRRENGFGSTDIKK